MPVTSRCALLEFACSIALYVLHVLGCGAIIQENLMGRYYIPGQLPFHFGDELYKCPDWP
jgi:hypothetical protein